MALRELPLSQGLAALVDEDDWDRVIKGPKWYAIRDHKTFYAVRHVYRGGKRTLEQMHRVILGVPPGALTDHKDGDGLNNVRGNLRQCTPDESNRNRSGKRPGSKGVRLEAGKWRARIKDGDRFLSLGSYVNHADAVAAYNIAARRLYKDFARLNPCKSSE